VRSEGVRISTGWGRNSIKLSDKVMPMRCRAAAGNDSECAGRSASSALKTGRMPPARCGVAALSAGSPITFAGGSLPQPAPTAIARVARVTTLQPGGKSPLRWRRNDVRWNVVGTGPAPRKPVIWPFGKRSIAGEFNDQRCATAICRPSLLRAPNKDEAAAVLPCQPHSSAYSENSSRPPAESSAHSSTIRSPRTGGFLINAILLRTTRHSQQLYDPAHEIVAAGEGSSLVDMGTQ